MADIYHFTHIDNLPGILSRREMCCHRNSGCERDIADSNIKGRRQRIPVRVAPYGMVGDYVPFYFAPRSPMLFRLQKEGIAARDLVYLVSTSEDVVAAGSRVVVTDGNAAHGLTTFHSVDDLGAIVDWPLMEAQMWTDTDDDRDRRRRRQAEFLVHDRLALDHIARFAVYDALTHVRVSAMLVAASFSQPVQTQAMWYFQP